MAGEIITVVTETSVETTVAVASNAVELLVSETERAPDFLEVENQSTSFEVVTTVVETVVEVESNLVSIAETLVLESAVETVVDVEIAPSETIAIEVPGDVEILVDGIPGPPGPRTFGVEFNIVVNEDLLAYQASSALLEVPIPEAYRATAPRYYWAFLDGIRQERGLGWNVTNSGAVLQLWIPTNPEEQAAYLAEGMTCSLWSAS